MVIMVMEIVFATKNKGKLSEINAVLAPVKVFAACDLGADEEIEETGETFAENAVIKAEAVAKLCPGKIVLADDSGLVIDALGGEPGVRSARFMGSDTAYTIKNARIIEMLADVSYEKRTARFVCAIAAAFPDGEIVTRTAAIEGFIAYEAAGAGGFGYDPIFYVPEYKQTTAEMSAELKNEVSHRGKALRLIKDVFAERGLL